MAVNPVATSINTQTNHVNNGQQQNKIGNEAKQNNTAQAGNTAPVSNDTVNITSTASQMQSLEKQLASLPVVDVQRVDAVKREISNGTFEINPTRIADKMIQIESIISNKLG